jgi:hypothetical protein
MTQLFQYYLHDDFNSHERREWMESEGVALSEQAWENLNDPFYEVCLLCEVDDLGNISIIKAK